MQVKQLIIYEILYPLTVMDKSSNNDWYYFYKFYMCVINHKEKNDFD